MTAPTNSEVGELFRKLVRRVAVRIALLTAALLLGWLFLPRPWEKKAVEMKPDATELAVAKHKRDRALRRVAEVERTPAEADLDNSAVTARRLALAHSDTGRFIAAADDDVRRYMALRARHDRLVEKAGWVGEQARALAKLLKEAQARADDATVPSVDFEVSLEKLVADAESAKAAAREIREELSRLVDAAVRRGTRAEKTLERAMLDIITRDRGEEIKKGAGLSPAPGLAPYLVTSCDYARVTPPGGPSRHRPSGGPGRRTSAGRRA
jgi:hypothetical protein